MKHFLIVAAALLVLTGCGRSTTAPEPARVRLAAWGDSVVYAQVGSPAMADVAVIARDVTSGDAVSDVSVQWSVVSGSASLSGSSSTTDEYGRATIRFTAGAAGTYRVRASSSRLTGTAPEIEVRVVSRPTINAVSPAPAAAGAIVTITGAGFSTDAAHNIVLFEGIRGTVTSATSTELQVRVPACVPGRVAAVTVGFPTFRSAAHNVAVTNDGGADITLAPGASVTLGDAGELACVRMPDTPDALYLLVAQHVGATQTPPLPLSLRAVGAQQILAAPQVPQQVAPHAEAWEAKLRARERSLRQYRLPDVAAHQPVAIPEVGDERTFNVLNQDNGFEKVTAALRLVTTRALFYVDVDAASSLGDDDLQSFGDLFDDPIYAADVEVFGEPSDIDANGRVLILLTPKINELTPRNSSSFIAGYFYGCDLVAASRCSGTNRAEIFYALVPDPQARWGDARTTAAVMSSVPTVIAHEFQHMINFAARNQTMESLWLSEGLAHTAEEIVADRLAARGDLQAAARFRNGNLSNAARFLATPASVNQLTDEPPGTLESRGAAWLFLRYLRGHHGGDALLRRLTASQRTGVANVVAEAGRPWDELRADFGVALWADAAPELADLLEPRQRFSGFNLRTAFGTGTFPLRPVNRQWSDFNAPVTLTSGGYSYSLLRAPSGVVPPLSFLMSDVSGRAPAFASLTILRVQ